MSLRERTRPGLGIIEPMREVVIAILAAFLIGIVCFVVRKAAQSVQINGIDCRTV
jgi:hypothetical protein